MKQVVQHVRNGKLAISDIPAPLVQPGQVLCTIEAMKMMNQIESEFAGHVRAMLVKNGEPVEFGQPLFIIE